MRLASLMLIASSLLAQKPVRVLVVTGGHDHEPSFYSVFDDPRFQTNVDPHPNAFRADFRKRADVLVLYDMIRDLDDDKKRANLRAFVEAGKGVVVLHHALGDSTDWAWWTEEVSGGRFPEHLQYKHDQQMPVKVVKPHPVTEGISDFVIEDETYKDMWISPKAQVLLRTTHPLSDGPVAWIGPNDKARVVTIQLGHGSPAHRNPNWQRLVKNAILWTAGR